MENNVTVVENVEALEADLSIKEVGEFIRDKIINFAGRKIAEFAYDKLNSNGTVVEMYDKNNYVKLLYHTVDNTQMSYEEWMANKTKMNLDFSLSINHTTNPNTFCGKVENIFKDIFIK